VVDPSGLKCLKSIFSEGNFITSIDFSGGRALLALAWIDQRLGVVVIFVHSSHPAERPLSAGNREAAFEVEVRLLCCMMRKTWVAVQQTPPFDQGLSYTSGLKGIFFLWDMVGIFKSDYKWSCIVI